jgi:hypothetical protein
MERIIKAIEEKLAKQEETILLQKYEIEGLKRKLAEAEETIKRQDFLLSETEEADDLKGEWE